MVRSDDAADERLSAELGGRPGPAPPVEAITGRADRNRLRRHVRRLGLACLVLVAAGSVAVMVRSSEEDVVIAGVGDTSGQLADSFPLPFGLEQPDGVVPIGRPADFAQARSVRDREAQRGHTLIAAYAVKADPVEVVRAWVDQLDRLDVDRVRIVQGHGPRGAWVEAQSHGGADSALLQVWATEDDPVLVVDIHRLSAATRDPEVIDELAELRDPEVVVPAGQRSVGDVLFSEAGDPVHLPPPARPLAPTIPVLRGNGGSFSVLAVTDPRAAIAAMLAEAMTYSAEGRAGDLEVQEEAGGVEVMTTSFQIVAGGWGFQVVSVQAPSDPYATVYVRSGSD